MWKGGIRAEARLVKLQGLVLDLQSQGNISDNQTAANDGTKVALRDFHSP